MFIWSNKKTQAYGFTISKLEENQFSLSLLDVHHQRGTVSCHLAENVVICHKYKVVLLGDKISFCATLLGNYKNNMNKKNCHLNSNHSEHFQDLPFRLKVTLIFLFSLSTFSAFDVISLSSQERKRSVKVKRVASCEVGIEKDHLVPVESKT